MSWCFGFCQKLPRPTPQSSIFVPLFCKSCRLSPSPDGKRWRAGKVLALEHAAAVWALDIVLRNPLGLHGFRVIAAIARWLFVPLNGSPSAASPRRNVSCWLVASLPCAGSGDFCDHVSFCGGPGKRHAVATSMLAMRGNRLNVMRFFVTMFVTPVLVSLNAVVVSPIKKKTVPMES